MTPSAEPPARPRVLIAGAGFIGRAVAEELAARDRIELRLVSRRPLARAGAAIAVVAADLNRRADRLRALEGVDVVLWLVHSLDRPDYADHDPALAAAFARDAAAAGVKRIVYLGALGPDDEAAPHTASRHATGRALASAGVPTVELRASVVIGRGSAVIEMVRALALRLPVLIVPAGAQALTQPVALGDATAALAEAALGPRAPGDLGARRRRRRPVERLAHRQRRPARPRPPPAPHALRDATPLEPHPRRPHPPLTDHERGARPRPRPPGDRHRPSPPLAGPRVDLPPRGPRRRPRPWI
jgi:uncharacterized protein YbjT (DUF2867 family)